MLNPRLYTPYYNLGVIYFKKGDYQRSAGLLERALQADLGDSINIITSSKLYFPMLAHIDIVEQDLRKKLKNSYRDCYRLLVLSHKNLKNYSKVLLYATRAVMSALHKAGFFVTAAIATASTVVDRQNYITLMKQVLKK